ncbi:porin [Microvirga antarctica]|uniref:porin n=1 Tax=Microvirga antarctica TaxID=2819233 RepID=UPI001B30FA87|nr:porin [Microvirga antarctica]
MFRPALLLVGILVGTLPASAGGPTPERSRAGVESERVCASQGAGFFSVPGTETCLRIGGRVRSDVVMGSGRSRLQDVSGVQTGARVTLDARTPTPYGPLRTVIRYQTPAMGH